MAVDVALLAATIVSQFLLPYIKLGAKGIADKVGERFSEVAANHVTDVAEKLWNRVKGLFRGTEDEPVTTLFEDDPEGLTRTLERRLEQHLRENASLADELSALIQSESPDGTGTGIRIIGASIAGVVDARGAVIHGGQVAGVIMGSPPSDPIETGPVPQEP